MQTNMFSTIVRFALLILPLPVLVAYTLVLSGCVATSPAIPNLYLARLDWKAVSSVKQAFSIRVGYYGVCADLPKRMICTATVYGRKASRLESDLFSKVDTSDVDIDAAKEFGILQKALSLQFRIFHSLVAASALLFLISLVALAAYAYAPRGGHAALEAKMSKLKYVALGTLFFSCAMCMTAAVSVTQVANALEWATAGAEAPMAIKRGTAVQILQWIALGFSMLFTAAATLWAAKTAAKEDDPVPSEEDKGEEVPMVDPPPVVPTA